MFYLYSSCLLKEEVLGVWPKNPGVGFWQCHLLAELGGAAVHFLEPPFLHLYNGTRTARIKV